MLQLSDINQIVSSSSGLASGINGDNKFTLRDVEEIISLIG
jgi:hypothetical protein